MSLASIFIASLAGVVFAFLLRFFHILEVPKGAPKADDELYETGYYPLQYVRRLKMQYTRRIMAFLAADGFLALAVFLPYVSKAIALNILIGLGLILGAAYKLR